MVNDILEARMPDFYRLGYSFGAKAMAAVMLIELGVGFLNQLPEPVIPYLELPYTEEECQPLLPEDDDEEMADGAEAEQQGGSGDNVAEGGDQNKSAEEENQDRAAKDEIHVEID